MYNQFADDSGGTTSTRSSSRRGQRHLYTYVLQNRVLLRRIYSESLTLSYVFINDSWKSRSETQPVLKTRVTCLLFCSSLSLLLNPSSHLYHFSLGKLHVSDDNLR